jgi:hypothetical protein
MVVTKISSNKLTVATGESVQVWSRKTRSELGGRAHPARHDIGIGLVRKPAMNHKKALHGGRASLRIASNKVSGLLPDTARYMAVYAAFLSFFFKLFSLPSCLAIFALRALISFFRLASTAFRKYYRLPWVIHSLRTLLVYTLYIEKIDSGAQVVAVRCRVAFESC